MCGGGGNKKVYSDIIFNVDVLNECLTLQQQKLGGGGYPLPSPLVPIPCDET